MSKLKKALSLFTVVLMLAALFSACGPGGGAGGGNVTYGRYVETDISPENMNGYPWAFAAFKGGVLDLVVREDKREGDKTTVINHRWRSTDDGATWQSVSMDWVLPYQKDYSEYYERGEQPPEEVYINNIFLMENGDLLAQISTYTWNEENSTQTSRTILKRVTLDGTVSDFSIPEYDQAATEGDGAWMDTVKALPGGRMFLKYQIQPSPDAWEDPNFDYNSLQRSGVYDINTGEKLYDLKFNGYDAFSNSTTLFLNDYEEGIKAYNLSDGSPSTAPMPTKEQMQRLTNSYSGNTFVDDSNNFYTINARGMFKYPAAGGGGQPASSQAAQASQASQPAQASQAASGSAPAADSSEPIQVMDGLNYTYGSPLYNINGMTFDPETEIMTVAVFEYGQYDNSVTGRLLRYEWDDEAVASSDQTITVYSLYDNYSVRLALAEFKRQNPEVFVKYDTAFSEEEQFNMLARAAGDMSVSDTTGGSGTGQTVEDAERALNTELLNGGGPDVLILDGLSVESLAGKGVLLDLKDLVGESDAYPGLMAAMENGGKLQAVPTGFRMPTFVGEKSYVGQFTSFDALMTAIQSGAGIPAYQEYDPEWTEEEQMAYYENMNKPKPAEERPVIYFETLDDLFNTFYTMNAPALYSDTGIDQANLSSFLQSVKLVSDKYELTNPEKMQSGGMMSGGSVMMASSSMYMNRSDTYSATLDRFTSQQGRLGYSNLGSTSVLMNISFNLFYSSQWGGGKVVMAEPMTSDESGAADDTEGATDEDAASEGTAPEDTAPEGGQPGESQPKPDPAVILAPGLKQGVFIPMQMVGVTSTSKQPELAKAFVTTMLSPDVQKHDMGNGFPVSQSAFKTIYDDYAGYKNIWAAEGEETPTMMPLDYEAMVAQLSTPLFDISYLRTAIQGPVQEYCTGSISLEEAVGRVVKETELYFAERQ